MSTNAGASAFPSEIVGNTTNMGHEESHDLDVDNDELGHKNHDSETSVSLICLFVKAEQWSGAP